MEYKLISAFYSRKCFQNICFERIIDMPLSFSVVNIRLICKCILPNMTTVKSDAILSIEGNCHLCQIIDCNVMSWITLNLWGDMSGQQQKETNNT